MKFGRTAFVAAIRYFLAVTLLGLCDMPALAQDDPFAQQPSGPTPSTKRQLSGIDARIHFETSVQPAEARRGETVRLTITGVLAPGFHTYPLTQRAAGDAQDETQLSHLSYGASKNFKVLWPLTESNPAVEHVEGVGAFLEQHGTFTWSQDVLVLPEASPGDQLLDCRIRLQVCDKTCIQGEMELHPRIRILDGAAMPLSPEIRQRLSIAKPPVRIVQVDGSNSREQGPATDPNGSAAIQPDRTTQPGTRELVLASVAAAIAMLFTPCVFPMIPITVSFFLKQSERQHHNALVTAGVYSATIVVVLTAAVLVLGGLIITLANDAWVNLGFGILLVFFALSLFGMYEIELPAGLARFTAAHEGKGGYAGAVFMALTFTITSFTCTGPFLGPLLIPIKEFQLGLQQRALGALCYSATFAAPFFVLALFPSLLRRLPKSGNWLNAVKVVMGFLELAAALKFLANTDLAWSPGNPLLFSYDSVLCAWVALSVACGLYLLGLFRLPHDTPSEHIGVARMVLASCFLALALYMAPALWRVTPQGALGKGIVAFLPLDTRPVSDEPGASTKALAWLQDYESAWRQATAQNKLIFIDFTGQNCVNCRYNEKNVFPNNAVREQLEKYVRVQLYTDFVPDARLSASESQKLGKRNSMWQQGTFGDASNPLYAIIRPDKTRPVENGPQGSERLSGQVIGVRKGLIAREQIDDFVQFLSNPSTQQAHLRAAGGELDPSE